MYYAYPALSQEVARAGSPRETYMALMEHVSGLVAQYNRTRDSDYDSDDEDAEEEKKAMGFSRDILVQGALRLIPALAISMYMSGCCFEQRNPFLRIYRMSQSKFGLPLSQPLSIKSEGTDLRCRQTYLVPQRWNACPPSGAAKRRPLRARFLCGCLPFSAPCTTMYVWAASFFHTRCGAVSVAHSSQIAN